MNYFCTFSFLLLTFGAVVLYGDGDAEIAGYSKKVMNLESNMELSEIPEYEVLFWPTYSTDSRKSSKGSSIKAEGDISIKFNKAPTKKKHKFEVFIEITERPQGKITVNPNPVVVVQEKPIKIEIPIQANSPAVTEKHKTTTVRNVIRTTISSVVNKKPTTASTQVVISNSKPGQTKPTVKPTSQVTAKPNSQKLTVKPTLQVTVKPTNQKPQKIGSNSLKNTTVASLQATVAPIKVTTNQKPQKIGSNSLKNTTVASLQATVAPIKVTSKPEITTKPNKQKPQQQSSGLCTCVLGVCTCCSGPLLALLSQKACMRVVYTPEEFAFDYSLMLNNRVLYQNKVSGKNPSPACIGIPRFNRVKLCARFSNIYFVGRNVHFCMGIEGRWDYEELFSLPFDCVRMGNQGFAIVKPEEGGGIAIPGGVDSIIDVGGDDVEDYDENVVRNIFFY